MVVLRGFVTAFRTDLRFLVLGLRMLEGQTVSMNDANALGVGIGSRILNDEHISRAKKLIREGLAMIEGCVAVCLLVPAIHCLLHYADGAAIWGLLRLLWMMSFGELFVHSCFFLFIRVLSRRSCVRPPNPLQNVITRSAKI